MQVHVDGIETHVARTHLAEDGVQVGAVVVQQPACTVHDARDRLDLAFEHPERGGIGEHDARGLRPHRLHQRIEVDIALGIDRDLFDRAAAHGGGRGIGAMRRRRDDDLVAGQVAPRPMIGADHGDAGELAVRTGHRAERHRRHAGDLLQHVLQLEHATEEALSDRRRCKRMATEELRQHRVLVTGLGVVLHRAGTERVEVRVDREVQLREAREMAHRIEFAHLRQQRRLATA